MTSRFRPPEVRKYFAKKLDKLRWKANQGQALCPFHPDRRPSLSINVKEGVFYCHACGAKGDVFDFEAKSAGCDKATAKRRLTKLLERASASRNARIVARYPYTDETGKSLFRQVRFEPKGFAFQRPDGKGGWIWGLTGVRRVPYRLPEVLKATKVWIAEGEKDAETLRDLGLAATSNPGGAGRWSDEYSRFLKGKKVRIVQDDDGPGRRHAQQVAESVAKFAAEVKLLPPFKGAKDVSDWVEQGGAREKLLWIAKNTQPFVPGLSSDSVSSVSIAQVRGQHIVGMVEQFFHDYTVLPQGLPLVLSLWVMGTWLFDVFDCFPYLNITSPTKRCGKTRVGEVLELVCARPFFSANISEAALFRSIAQDRPTLIFDEAETLANRKSERAQYLLSILQMGFRRNGVVPRCVGQDHAVEKFPVFCPKVVIAIGDLPDTLRDRSIVVSMRRRAPGESVLPFRYRKVSELAEGTAAASKEWAEANRTSVERAYSKQRVDFAEDREADLWDVIFSIAVTAVPGRLKELKETALRLSRDKSAADEDTSLKLRLLSDIRSVFLKGKGKRSRLATENLIAGLKLIPEGPWQDLTALKMSRMLRPFGVSPHQLWIDDWNVRGYERSDFVSVWERYLSSSESP